MKFVIAALSLIFLIAAPHSASADFFVWDDEKSNISLTYPDTWHLTSNQKPRDIFTINGPNDYKDRPSCRLSMIDDARFAIFPPHFYRSAQKISYNKEYWETEVFKHYKDGDVLQYGDNAGLGKSFGSYILVDYIDDRFEQDIEMRALSMAGYFYDKAYMFECTAHRDGFDKWRPLFQSIAGSVKTRNVFSAQPHGYYRDFINN